MIYLANQEVDFIERNLRYDVAYQLEKHIGTDMIVSLLDYETSQAFSKHFDLEIPENDPIISGYNSPDDAIVMLEDDLEEGDEVISLIYKPQYYEYLRYQAIGGTYYNDDE